MAISRRQLLGGLLSGCMPALAGCGSDNGTADEPESDSEPDEDSPQVGDIFLNASFPMEIYNPEANTRLAQIHWHGRLSNSHWHQGPLSVPLDRWESYEMRALDQNREALALGENQQFQLDLARSEETPDDLLEYEISGQNIDIRGLKPGDGQYVFRLISGDQIEWESPLLQISVE